MDLFQFWIFLGISNFVVPLCQQGCLSCSTDNVCLLCDVTNFYFNLNDACTKQDQQFYCTIINTNGQCLQCLSSYFLDLNTKKCIKIPQQNSVQNCLDYGSNQTCITCQKNFYLSEGNCLFVETQIDYCIHYSGMSTCQKCREGYVLNFNHKSCELIEEKNNCARYNLLQCQNCMQGFLLNKNLFAFNNSNLESNDQKNLMASLMNNIVENFNEDNFEMNQVCQKIEVTNCKEILDYDSCQSCVQGYFLDQQQKCVLNPLPQIENCQVYSSATKCQICNNRYHLQNNKCIEVQNIDYCKVYDGSKSVSACLQCEVNFYSTGSQCEQRQFSQQIQNCSKLSQEKDTCEICDQNYLLSSDGLKCFKKILNCEIHNDLLLSQENLKCLKCQAGFYPASEFSCLQGEDQNCDIYNQQQICMQCVNEYYLNQEKKCEPQSIIQNCQYYSKQTPNECLFCSDNFQNFKILKYCKFQPPIDNCVEYDNNTIQLRCIKCQPGYKLSGNQCIIIQIPHCAEEFNGSCVKCQQGYNLSNKNTEIICSLPFSFIQTNCEQTYSDLDVNSTFIHQDQCMQCLSNHYPINFSDNYICVSTSELYHFQFPDQLDENCLKFSYDQSCQQCKIDLFLEQGTCVQQCKSGTHQILGYNATGSNDSVQLELINFNICVDLFEEENVFAIAIDSSLENKDELDIIAQCHQKTLPVISIDSSKYTILQPNKDPFQFAKFPNLKHPQIDTCIEPNQLSPIQQNCEYYTEVSISLATGYRCLKCLQQYTSIVTKYSSDSYALENCVLNTNCSKEDFSPGLDLLWRKFFSCHSCSTTNKIPVLFIKTQSRYNPTPEGLRKFQLENLKRIDDNNNTNSNVQCIEFKPENIGYDIEDKSEIENFQNLPANCALGVVNLSITNGDATQNQTSLPSGEDRVQLAHYCAACKPSYRAQPINDVYNFVKIKCDFIQNCIGFKWMNSCSQCQVNHAYEYQNGVIKFDQCLKTIDKNCYAVLQSGQCQKCKKGFQLNRDFVCEQIKPINCQSSEMFSFKKLYGKNDINYALFTAGQGQGCVQCNQGYVSIQLNQTENLFQCVLSPYLQQNLGSLKNDTQYIKNCSNYGVEEGQVICVSCLSSFALNKNKTICYLTQQECRVALSEGQCQKCHDEFYLVQGKCLNNSIPFCLKPNNKQDYQQARCVQCEPEYYLTQDYQCQIGQVSNCEILEYQKPQKCNKCIDGYVLYQSSTRSYCYKLDENLRCSDAEIEVDQQYGALLNCTKCSNQSDFLTNDISLLNVKTSCMEFQGVQFCEEYDKSNSIQNSSLNCIKCQKGYFLTKEFSCNKRTYQSDLCQVYNSTQDDCMQCDQLQSFVNKFNQCQIKPKGISDCFEYTNLETCQKCKENFYLFNNKCLQISQENLIQNCKFYSDQNQCQQCNSQYLLVDNECVQIKALNCLTLESPYKCLSCRQGYILQTNDDTVDCILFEKPNCIVYEQSINNPCSICQKNYYPNQQGNCQLSNQIIDNCEQYEADGICKKCSQGFTLSLQKNSCLNLELHQGYYDSNCMNYVNDVQCQFCKLGYYFEQGKCVACKNLGCAVCNIQNQEQCKICKPTHYMNQNGICISISTGLTEDHVNIFPMIIFLLLLMFLY